MNEAIKNSCLIADDEAPTRALVRNILGATDFNFHEVGDGAEAVAACRASHPEIIIMDIEMRPMDGISATREIHKHHPECRIVIMSKHGSSQIRQASLEAGATEFVNKEHLVRLRSVVANLLRGSAADDTSAGTETELENTHQEKNSDR